MILNMMNGGSMMIDLTGPDGNAFVLLGYAQKFAKSLGYSAEETQSIIDRMQESDYTNLVTVFDEEFSQYVTLVGIEEFV